MDQLTIFDVVQEDADVAIVWCPGRVVKGTRITEGHYTAITNFYVGKKTGKREATCKACEKVRNAILNASKGYKKAKYHPETGEKWCYKVGDYGAHYTDPNNFHPNNQWNDNKNPACITCLALYWQAQEQKGRRSDPRYGAWEKAVKERDNNACVLCGSEDHLHAHHLDGYNWHEEGKYDVNNGVTLCIGHHNDFHETYGKGDNTRAQWEEYKAWYIDLTSG
jgi:hypothetical protein